MATRHKSRFLMLFCLVNVVLLSWWELSWKGKWRTERWHPPITLSENDQIPNLEDLFRAGDLRNLSVTNFDLQYSLHVEPLAISLCPSHRTDCQIYRNLIDTLSERSLGGDVRLHVVPLDPLAWLREVDSGRSHMFTRSLTDDLHAARDYIRFKGSDHVFICLAESCNDWGQGFAKMLADEQGSRAIFVGVNVDRNNLQWPCPLRVISLDDSDLNGMEALVQKILSLATLMIEKTNRWMCSNDQHPTNHFGKYEVTTTTGIVYMDEYGFMMCQIPKSGSTMLMILLRRMLHKEDWNSEENGLPHNPMISGVHWLSEDDNETLAEALYNDPSFIKAAVVRHPIPRLLSGYLDKMSYEKGYWRIPQLREYVDEHGEPSFAEFVEFLLEHYPDPYQPGLDSHFAIQASMCGLKDYRFDFVASLTECGPEFKEFSQSLGFWEDYVSTGFGQDGTQAFGERSYESRQYKSSNLVWEHYTDDLLHKVYEYYKDDFIRFGYTLDQIYATKPREK